LVKVFLSWSGEVSHAVASALRDWLPSVLQTVEPYMSSKDIDKGARWAIDIGEELDSSDFGILCVTGDNLMSQWLNFEAGALSKSMESSRVAPFLVGVHAADLVGPLAQFQATTATRDDVLRLVASMNRASDHRIDEQRLAAAVDLWWPQLETRLANVNSGSPAATRARREISDMVEELLELTRGMQRNPVRVLSNGLVVTERRHEPAGPHLEPDQQGAMFEEVRTAFSAAGFDSPMMFRAASRDLYLDVNASEADSGALRAALVEIANRYGVTVELTAHTQLDGS